MTESREAVTSMQTVDLAELLRQRVSETAGAEDDFMAIRKGELRQILNELVASELAELQAERWAVVGAIKKIQVGDSYGCTCPGDMCSGLQMSVCKKTRAAWLATKA
jgi:hypothetical protein